MSKERLFGASSISFAISYAISIPICDGGFLHRGTGPILPNLPSSDSNEDREIDFDYHRDFMGQDVPAGQFPTADPGPIHQFLSGIPDWLNFNPEDLDRLWKAFTFL
jgi:hypothetical protein